MGQNSETQPVESLTPNEWEIKFCPIFPQEHAQVLAGVGKNYKEYAQKSGKHLDFGRYVRHG